MPNLAFLHLHKLESHPLREPSCERPSNIPLFDEQNPYDTHYMRDMCLDMDMTLSAIWKNKLEVQIGLHVLQTTYITIPSASMFYKHLNRNSRNVPVLNYVHMRFANFKISIRYNWTTAEAKALIRHRNTMMRLHRRDQMGTTSPLSGLDNPLEWPVPGFYEENNMPIGHNVLGPILWGRWKTVWVRVQWFPTGGARAYEKSTGVRR
jgi:hypothetical protein